VISTPVWDDEKLNYLENIFFRVCDASNLMILNNGLLFYISPPRSSNSVINFTTATRNLAIISDVTTEFDPYNSDHFPINIDVHETRFSASQFIYKIKLSKI